MSKGKTILITGGAGFLGSHLAGNLLDAGSRVIVMDNLLTGDIRNISGFTDRNFLFIEHDVTQHINVDEPIDFVLHFASPASPIDYLQHPIHTLRSVLSELTMPWVWRSTTTPHSCWLPHRRSTATHK